MEQLVILLLIALISLINWLVKKSSELREARKLEKGAGKTEESLRGRSIFTGRIPIGKVSCAGSEKLWVCLKKQLLPFLRRGWNKPVPPPLPLPLPKAPALARPVTHPIRAVSSRVAPVA